MSSAKNCFVQCCDVCFADFFRFFSAYLTCLIKTGILQILFERRNQGTPDAEAMSRHNLTFLLGSVLKPPLIELDDEGNYKYGMCTINVVRGYRDAGDHKNFMKSDNPIIITRDASVLKEIETWQENDIVFVKGVIAAKTIQKGSFCQHCGGRNSAEGTLVYVNPIYAEKRVHLNTQEEALKYLSEHREISNQVYILGTLCRDPKKITPKEGLIVTQYQIALNRKYFIRSDPPSIKADYPWVKSYGQNAVDDKERLHVGSKVFIDGCLQARSVQKHAVCIHCGEKYDWKDRAMEIVPYETEYICDYYTDTDIEEKRRRETQAALNKVFGEEDTSELSEEL